MQQPQLPADYVAVEAKRCGFGEVVLDGCAPATEAQRSHPGQAAHRNDKNKGVTKRKRAAKVRRAYCGVSTLGSPGVTHDAVNLPGTKFMAG